MFLDVSRQNTTENIIVQSGKNPIKSESNGPRGYIRLFFATIEFPVMARPDIRRREDFMSREDLKALSDSLDHLNPSSVRDTLRGKPPSCELNHLRRS